MATPVRNEDPGTDHVLKSFEEMVGYIQDDGEDEIGVRRVKFMGSLLQAAPDGLLLWTQNVRVGTPENTARFAPLVRSDINIPGALAVIATELTHSKTKVGGRIQEVVDLINSEPALKDELFAVVPYIIPEAAAPESEDEIEDLNESKLDTTESKLDMLLADASELPIRVNTKAVKGAPVHWKIEHSDGIIIYIPADHPDVSHLEDLSEAGIPLTLSNVRKQARKRTASEASLDQENPVQETPNSRQTRKASLKLLMEKARDDKVRAIKIKIRERQALLQRLNPGLTSDTIQFRSFGWAKYEVEYRNRFSPRENRMAVTQSVWESLFGPTHFNLDSAQLKNVEVHYDRYKNHHAGYDVEVAKDGRVD
jgi:hypothetical protein